MSRMNSKTSRTVIGDPAAYLAATYPGKPVKLLRSVCIDGRRTPAYVISELNGCGVNAAACLVSFASGKERVFGQSLDICKSIALNGYSRKRDGAVDFYTKLGKEAPYIRKCLQAASVPFTARSSLFAKGRAVKEILAGRPVLLNIGISKQYRDHTVTAYGFEEYTVGPRGRKILFFKVRDGYSTEDRYLEYKGILGISVTYLKHQKH